MIRFSHEANSWQVLNQWVRDWNNLSPKYVRQLLDMGYILIVDFDPK